jgi:hypothetical protein
MARSRTWITAVGTAIGVSAGAGAAQLGIAYGLGVITWAPAAPTDAPSAWYASLAWVTWLAANSTIIGALAGGLIGRSAASADSPDSAARSGSAAHSASAADSASGARPVRQSLAVGWQVVLSLAAAIGALITVPLAALPARVAQQVDNAAPQFTAGGYAVAGVIIGLLVAIGALAGRAAAANVITLTALIWTIAVAAVIDGLRHGVAQPTALLGMWPLTDSAWLRGMVNVSGALAMLAIAFAVGALTAIPASRRGDNRVGVALSGAAGPVLVAAAYFLTTPGAADRNLQLSACLIAPYAVLAGIGGSVLVSSIGAAARRSRDAAGTALVNQAADPRDELAATAASPAASGVAITPSSGVATKPSRGVATKPPRKAAAKIEAGDLATKTDDDGGAGVDEPKPRSRFGRALSSVRFSRAKQEDELEKDLWPAAVTPAQRGPKGEPEPTQRGPKGEPEPTQRGPKAEPAPAQRGPKSEPAPGSGTWSEITTELSAKPAKSEPALFDPAGSDSADAVRQAGRKSSRTPSGG